ncbi:hypothetical protein AKJ61_01280 [candidate division MSBL1 archaeon SCGC-AAA259B11]|uniref:CARDB domain-containing protein n=1 Tax=candidate division MSBL1 archaeon SCGC-AAA259B11 TaxID=1698260 RepID=A0A133U7Q1_9EURY|nr:hypothetical protein AKJ61_01280 [candidate division MSBL1 archaeon SCGC-AAA259B11]
MDKKKIGLVIIGIVVILGIIGALLSRGEEEVEPANLQVSELNVTPSEVLTNETVNISANVKNIGGRKGSENIKFIVGEGVAKIFNITLSPGENKIVKFGIRKEEAGTYNVEVSGMTDSFVAVEPAAKFEVRDLIVEPLGCAPGENVTVSVNVQNTGEVKGTHTLKLRVDGTVEKGKNIELGPGRNSTISFTLSRKTTGTYSVKVDRLERAFGVLKPIEPAEFEAKAIEFVKLLGAQKFDKAKKMLIDSPHVDELMLGIKEGWENIVVDHGNMQEIENVRVESRAGYWGPEIVNSTAVHVLTQFKKARLDIKVNFVGEYGINGVYSKGTPLHAGILS